MKTIKTLTHEDEQIIPSYLNILAKGIAYVESTYPAHVIKLARDRYTKEYMQENLKSGKDRRFVGHFTDNNLDGILIESANKVSTGEFVIDRTVLHWLVSDVHGQGVGSSLLIDSIERARKKKKDAVSLIVAPSNERAIKLYKKLGFEVNCMFDDKSMVLMYNYLNKKIKPK